MGSIACASSFSSIGCGHLVSLDLILAGCSGSSPDCHFLQAYLSDWSARFGTPPDKLPPKDTFWDSPVVACGRAQVQSCLDSPFQLPVIVETGCLRCRFHPAASNLTMRQSGLQSVYVLGWACVSRTFADAARRSTLAVWSALSANRSSRHYILNDLVARAFVPVAKEPVGLDTLRRQEK